MEPFTVSSFNAALLVALISEKRRWKNCRCGGEMPGCVPRVSVALAAAEPAVPCGAGLGVPGVALVRESSDARAAFALLFLFCF